MTESTEYSYEGVRQSFAIHCWYFVEIRFIGIGTESKYFRRLCRRYCRGIWQPGLNPLQGVMLVEQKGVKIKFKDKCKLKRQCSVYLLPSCSCLEAISSKRTKQRKTVEFVALCILKAIVVVSKSSINKLICVGLSRIRPRPLSAVFILSWQNTPHCRKKWE